ncbi:MAG: NAD-dependent epimerase/dehydratase family protein [Thaumarchaeota archaeon]|nr:NAD-dependent epimerase/dehydratase family protein [Nitrososphaerota archaeon]
MRCIITGGAGFIGSHLTEQLLRNKDEVLCVDDLSRGNLSNLEIANKSKNFRFVQGNLSSQEFAHQAIRDAEIVYHLAAVNGTRFFYEKPRFVIETNIKTTENVLEAANRNGIGKVVFASSSEVYGYPTEFPTPETAQLVFDSPVVSRWSYAISKLSDEHLCFAYQKEFGLSVTCLRIFNTYGPRLDGSPYGQVVSIFIKRALGGQDLEIFGSGDQTRSFAYVGDTVRGITLSAKYASKNPEIFNIGSEIEVSINDLAERIIAACQKFSENIRIIHLPEMTGDSPRRHPSLQKAKELLGYTPTVSLEEGLRYTIDWFRSGRN